MRSATPTAGPTASRRMPARCRSCGCTASSVPRPGGRTTTGSTRSRCSRCPPTRSPSAPPSARSSMSHHFDWMPETQDITDVYCFDGPSDDDGPRTIFGMNVSPTGPNGEADQPFEDSVTFYELRLDLDGDFVEEITWRFTFPKDSTGTQHVRVAQLTGADATDRTAPGQIITPPNTPIGQVVNLSHGIKMFTGKRRDSFFNFLPFPATMRTALFNGTNPDLSVSATGPVVDTFLKGNVYSILLDLPAGITGTNPIQCWGTTAIVDKDHPQGITIQRGAAPVINVLYNWSGVPTLPNYP